MHKTHEKVEDVLTDERFLTWYFSVVDNESDNWQTMLEADPHLQSLNNEAKIIMKNYTLKKDALQKTRLPRLIEN